MIPFLKKFEKCVVIALIAMMIVVVSVSTVELGWIIVKDFIQPPMFWLEIADLLQIFGFFMLVLIGIELLETIKAYLVDNVVHVEIVLEVALIAIARNGNHHGYEHIRRLDDHRHCCPDSGRSRRLLCGQTSIRGSTFVKPGTCIIHG